MFESPRLCDLSLMLWVRWFMIELAYILFDPLIQLVVVSYCLECFLMVCSLLKHLVCYLPVKSLLTSPPFQGPFPPFGGWLFLVIWSDLFLNFLWCDVYYVKTHPPNEFQVHIFPFDRVFGVVTFRLPLGFHPIFSYPKPHGLTWVQGGYLFWCLKNLCFNFQLNPMWKSKVIGPTSWVPNLGINGGQGKWPRMFPNVLIWFYSDSSIYLHLPTCI